MNNAIALLLIKLKLRRSLCTQSNQSHSYPYSLSKKRDHPFPSLQWQSVYGKGEKQRTVHTQQVNKLLFYPGDFRSANSEAQDEWIKGLGNYLYAELGSPRFGGYCRFAHLFQIIAFQTY